MMFVKSWHTTNYFPMPPVAGCPTDPSPDQHTAVLELLMWQQRQRYVPALFDNILMIQKPHGDHIRNQQGTLSTQDSRIHENAKMDSALQRYEALFSFLPSFP
jgi:hypothetical protein